MDAKISHTSTSASAKIFSHGSSAAGSYGIKIKSSLRLLPIRPCFVDFLILGQAVSLFPPAVVASIFAYIGLLGLDGSRYLSIFYEVWSHILHTRHLVIRIFPSSVAFSVKGHAVSDDHHDDFALAASFVTYAFIL